MRDAEPSASSESPGDAPASRAEPYHGDRAALRELWLLADDSELEIASYMHRGVVLVVRSDRGADVLGHLLLTEEGEGVAELKSMAVVERMQGQGLGRLLVGAAIEHCRRTGVKQLIVATAAAGIGQLRFYQRMGFRMLRIERDAFGPHTGYAEGIELEGIPLRDRVWFSMSL